MDLIKKHIYKSLSQSFLFIALGYQFSVYFTLCQSKNQIADYIEFDLQSQQNPPNYLYFYAYLDSNPTVMFKHKAEQFRKQIRRQYLNEYFKKKRKQFNLIPQPPQSQQMSNISNINQKVHKIILQNNKMIPEKGIPDLDELNCIATCSQIQLGIQCLIKTDIPSGTLPYLSPLYYSTKQQHLATCIFANITYIKSEIRPSYQFMRNITNIIENSDMYECVNLPEQQQNLITKNMLIDTVDNCLLIIFHLMIDYVQAIQFYVTECNVINMLYGMYEMGADHFTGDKILKIMTIVTAYHKGKKEKNVVKKFLKNYISILENTNNQDFIYLSLLNIKQLLSIYVDAIQPQQRIPHFETYNNSKNTQAQKQLQEIISRIDKSRVIQKITHLYPHIASQTHITRCVFFIVKIMLTKMERNSVEKKLFPLLNRLIDAIYRDDISGNNKEEQQKNNLFSQKQSPQDKFIEKIYIRTEFYQIIYAFLQIWPSDHDILMKNPIFEKIWQKYLEFEETSANDSPFTSETREYFIYIFGMLAFSGKLNQNLKNMLKVSIERYRMSEENYEKDQKRLQNGSLEGFISNIERELQNQTDYEI